MKTWKMRFPGTKEMLTELQAGDRVLISGTIMTARDEAHKRLYNLAVGGKPWPIDVRGQLIYYVGPSPEFGSYAVGSAGPTTSARMDAFTPLVLERGAIATLGKGYRSREVQEAMLKHQAVYLVAIGGVGALLGSHIVRREVIAYEDLGPECISRLWIEDFPAFVAFDTGGNDIYQEQAKWQGKTF